MLDLSSSYNMIPIGKSREFTKKPSPYYAIIIIELYQDSLRQRSRLLGVKPILKRLFYPKY